MDDCLGVAFALFGILQTENPGKLMFKAIDRVVGALFTQAHAVDVWNVAVRFVVDAEDGGSIAPPVWFVGGGHFLVVGECSERIIHRLHWVVKAFKELWEEIARVHCMC